MDPVPGRGAAWQDRATSGKQPWRPRGEQPGGFSGSLLSTEGTPALSQQVLPSAAIPQRHSSTPGTQAVTPSSDGIMSNVAAALVPWPLGQHGFSSDSQQPAFA